VQLSKKPAEEGSQLIKIVGPSQVNVVPGFNFITLIEACYAKRDDRNFLAQSSALAYSPGGRKHLDSIKAQTDQNQIGRAKTGLLGRFLVIPGGSHLVTAGAEQSFYPIARLFHILNHKDSRPPFSIRCHGLP